MMGKFSLESPIFDGKNPWVSGVDFPLNQSIDDGLEWLETSTFRLSLGPARAPLLRLSPALGVVVEFPAGDDNA